MLESTVECLQCPRRQKGSPKGLNARCGSALAIHATRSEGADIRSGHLECKRCRAKFPILAGVLVLVEDARLYLLGHVKGVSRIVPDSEIPREWRAQFISAREEISVEHIEEDLESERVVSLYAMNHYLSAAEPGNPPWWAPRNGTCDPTFDRFIRDHWDHGPLNRIAKWIHHSPSGNVIELGCGVGGLYPRIKHHSRGYLGIDSSFASIAMGRYLALGASVEGTVRIPEDLLRGPVTREVRIPVPKKLETKGDLIVGDLTISFLRPGRWDHAVALNAIDMLEDPMDLPKLQSELLKPGGTAIQSCPYIWHESVARKLRGRLPRDVKDSARAVEWLYRQKGFELEEIIDQVPWLFFKHVRQLEIYSVHLLRATQNPNRPR